MTQLIFLIAFIYSAEDANSTQTLHVGINAPTTENAYTETAKYLQFFLDREYKQRA